MTSPAGRLFAVMWALASAWHLLGNEWLGGTGTKLVLTASIVWVLIRPREPLALATLAIAGLALMWDEAPVLGNHWLLAGFINLAILSALAWSAIQRRRGGRAPSALAESPEAVAAFDRAFAPTARLSLLGFYVFAAFAKLNAGFFDPAVSCGPIYFRESMSSIGLPTAAGSRLVDWAVIVGPTVIELAIPVLLVLRRTRHLGVVVALGFHSVLAIDQAHQFYDFSSVLAALFVLLLPRSFAAHVTDRLRGWRERFLPSVRSGLLGPAGALGLGVVLALSALDHLGPDSSRLVGWYLWQPFTIGLIILVVGYLRAERPVPTSATFVPAHAALGLIPLLVVLNGVTPYVEVKSASGWNMYANLRLVDGESNHYIVRRSFPLTDHHRDLVRIVETDSPGLQWYIDGEYALTWNQLRVYLSDRPDVSLTYEHQGVQVTLGRAADDPALVAPLPVWQEKLQVFRAVDLTDPERCTPVWGPAR